jgi:hypothetical protein
MFLDQLNACSVLEDRKVEAVEICEKLAFERRVYVRPDLRNAMA